MLQTVAEESDVEGVTDKSEPMEKERKQKRVTEYYAEKERDPYRKNDIEIEHHTMSESSTEDIYKDSLSYETASTIKESVPGLEKINRVGKLRTGKIPL